MDFFMKLFVSFPSFQVHDMGVHARVQNGMSALDHAKKECKADIVRMIEVCVLQNTCKF